ncbi:glycosyltransferase family 61 protein [uncultured Mailhella sp.]|uniref:glycosyltransferase family 61 protein n=1 Tax=uncultured Mailhella sp. TaxID=1981031 RepID=UPI00260CF553|nr:glycosyltransferase family 61 protein [uncultured Mailhella sp.]
MGFAIENRLFVYDEEKWKTLLNKDYELEAPTVTEVDNGIVLPLRKYKDYGYVFAGGVCDKKFNFVAGGHFFYHDNSSPSACSRSYIPSEPVHIRHETVVFGGILHNIFAITLSNDLSRLWYLADHPEIPYKFIFIEDRLWGKFTFFNILEAAGLPKDRIEIIEYPTQFDKVIVPDQTFYFFSNYRIGVDKIFNYMRSLVKPGPYKKVYLSRSALKSKREITFNEEYFENFYKKRGYEIVHPEQLPFTEQLSIMAGADEVVATDGSLPLLAQFCKPETKVVILLRAFQYVSQTPIAVSSTIKNCWIVDVHFNFLPATLDGGAELVGPTSCWRRYLEHEHIPHTPEEVSEEIHIKPLLYDYIRLWCQTAKDVEIFGNDNAFCLKNYSLIDILDWANMIFCGNKIDRSLYPDRNDVVWLRNQNQRLEKKILHRRIKKHLRKLKNWIKNLIKKKS